MIEYQVVVCSTFRELQDLVNEAIKEGWKPQGGVADTNDYCSQAMVREKS